MSDDVDALFGEKPRPSFTGRLYSERQPLPGPPVAAPEPAELSADAGVYRPYGFMPSNTVGESCELRGWMPGTVTEQGIVFQYRFLMEVGYVGDGMLKLVFPASIIAIEGQRLTELRQKLARRMVTFIQQYHPRQWPTPLEGEPLVERIEVVRPESFKALA